MAQQDTIKEFLVALGFKVDQSSLKKFTSGIEEATKATVKLVATIEGAALAVGTGVAAAASNLENLYWASKKAETSATNLMAIGKAAQNMGASIADAQGAVRTLEEAIRYKPGNEGFLKSLGVETRDAKGNLRQVSDILTDLGEQLGSKDLVFSKQAATILGLSDDVFRAIMNPQFREEYQRQQTQLKASGFDKAAEDARKFMIELRNLQSILQGFGLQVFETLQVRFGVSLKQIEQWFKTNGPMITSRLADIVAMMLKLAEAAIPAILAVVDAFMAADRATDGWSTKIIALIALLKWFGAGVLISALGNIASAFVGIVVAINPAILAVGALIAAVLALNIDWQEAIADMLSVFDSFISFLQKSGKLILTIFVGNSNDIREAWLNLTEDLGFDWNKFVDWIADSGPRMLEAIENAFSAGFNWIEDRFTQLMDAFPEIWGGKTAKEGASKYKDALKTIDDTVDRIKGSPVGQEVSSAISGLEQSPIGKELALGKKEARGIRNNNPGNLNFVGQKGAVKEEGPNGRFAVFQTAEEGLNALANQLKLYAKRGIDTVQGIIGKFAPPFENNTQGYIQRVSRALGVSATQSVNVADPAVLSRMMDSIIRMENGRNPYSSNQLAMAAGGNGYASQGVQIAQNTTINVTGGDNPEATGRAIASQQNRVNENLTRNFATVIR